MKTIDPFQYYFWGSERLELALVTQGKKERLLAGTKAGILAQLKCEKEVKIPEVFSPSEISLGEAAVKTAGTVARLMAGVLVHLNPMDAIRSEERRIRDKHRVELPLLFDRKAVLGTFLLNFERDRTEEWREAVNCLAKALEIGRIDKRHSSEEAKAVDILRGKWNSWDPVCQFGALKIWKDYCEIRETMLQGSGRQTNSRDLVKGFVCANENLTTAFSQQPNANPSLKKGKFSVDDPILRLPPMLHICEDELRVWTVRSVGVECYVLDRSFYPLKLHIAQKMIEENMKFAQCIECEKIFLTNNGNEKLCGASCKEARKKKTTAKYHENSKEDEIVRCWDKTRHYWHNRMAKARGIKGFPQRRLATIEERFEYCKEINVEKQALVKSGEISMQQYRIWCDGQINLVKNLMGEFENRKSSEERTR